ncbi:ABC transporter permease [Streptomyces sp. NBC_00878]|uniref:ABC transporter permease n=1 Tax=Streptomyces sp. NBC_00878 TaxID=2975854 RepID=UPI002252E9F4|nr:FtsX-like permease family protein [Streptomyces sp. NBC_00878]MCX4908270.1 ABC transporter permease [Streptomyces sp. NBC_00878]
MLRVTLAGLRAQTRQLLATLLAVALGVGFLAGTLIFGDTAKAAVYEEFARGAKNVDVFAMREESSDPLAPKTLKKIEAVSGVAAAEGRMTQLLPLLDKKGRLITSGGGSPGLGISAGDDQTMREYDLSEGRVPTAAGEAALDRATAEQTGYQPGDTVTVLDQKHAKRTLKLVGVIDLGISPRYSGQSVVVVTRAQLTAFTGASGYDEIAVRADSGVGADELAGRIGGVQPSGTKVLTGTERADILAKGTLGKVGGFFKALNVFAVIAVIVSAFVIHNTFTIRVAQRVRETALLRCTGANRGQLFRSVLVEAVVLGLLGAAVGIAGGLVVCYALFGGTAVIGQALPLHAPVVTTLPLVAAVLVGLVVTVLSSLIPAVRATRVPPLAALRAESSAPDTKRRIGLGRMVLAGVLLCLGVYLTLDGLSDAKTAVNTEDAMVQVVLGGVTAFLGVVVLAPLFAGRLIAFLGRLPGRRASVTYRLAAANAGRNPARTAATTVALMIGVSLMAGSSVIIATAEASASAEINDDFPVDYVLSAAMLEDVTSDDQGRPSAVAEEESSADKQPRGVPVTVAQQLRKDSRFATVARVRSTEGSIDNGKDDGLSVDNIAAVDPAGTSALPKARTGSMKALRKGTIAVYQGKEQAGLLKVAVGDRVKVKIAKGKARTLTVVATYTGFSQIGWAVVSWQDMAAVQNWKDDTKVLVKAAEGVPAKESRDRLDKVLVQHPLVSVSDTAGNQEKISDAAGSMIGIIAALLTFAIVIALIGIMNTLSLSILERTHESAMLRALGLTREQLQLTLVIEAVLMALVGAVVGITFGVVYGLATSQALLGSDGNLVLEVPLFQLAGYSALTALAGAIAAVLPARRAAKRPIVSAMADA